MGKEPTYKDLEQMLTERDKIVEVLRHSEARYRNILETIEEGYYDADLTGNFTFVNDSLCRILGRSHDELIGMNNREYTSPETAKRVFAIFNEIYRKGTGAKIIDYEVIRKDGSVVVIEVSASLIKDSSGKPVGFRGIIRDRTEQNQIEEALRQSETRHRHILETIEEGYWEIDLTGKFTFFNDAFAKICKASREELLGLNPQNFTTLEEGKRISKKFIEVYQTGIPVELIEYEVTRGDNSKLIVEMSVSLLKNAAGKPIGFCGISRDRTKQKMAENALQQSEEKYRLLVENAHDCIYIIQDGTVRFTNPRTEEFTGYSALELSGMPFMHLIHPRDRDTVSRLQQKSASRGLQSNVYEFRLINKKNDTLWVELNAVEIIWEGRPATLNFLRDITPQKRAEAQLLQAQKMEAIGTLAGGVAHDFNNLLMTIQGNASLMLLNIDANHPHYTRLKSIEQQVQTGADLTKQLLGAAKGGKYEVKPTNINLLIEDSLGLFGRTSKDIMIHQLLEEPVWTVEVDRSQIEQVLLNLYVNAGHAMPAGGELYVETQNVTLDEDYCEPYGIPPGNFVRISVTDTGTGMDEATQKRAFDPFFTTKEIGKGTGLGLASAYGIIKNHGGIINIYSEKGEGTTIKIYIPASEKAIIEGAALKVEHLSGTETVLFVDDQAEISELGRDLLGSLGYHVITASSGKEAIEIYQQDYNRIDLVILDMIMPGMGGGETFDQLKRIRPEVKVLLSSGYSINGQARTILDRGCKGFIQKPFSLADFSKKVRQVLDET